MQSSRLWGRNCRTSLTIASVFYNERETWLSGENEKNTLTGEIQ